jgi:hypothetical protein
MPDRITPKLSIAATSQAQNWLDGAPRTAIRGVTGATNKKTDAMRMFIKLETGAVVVMDEAQIDLLESSIQKTRQAHATFLNDKRQL